jgi:hypothetical protein
MILILMHQMGISTNKVSSVMLRPKKKEENSKNCKRADKMKQCHEIETNPSKYRAMHLRNNPLFWDKFIVYFFLDISIIIHIRISKLFVYFKPHEQFFSYLAAVTIACNRAANLDLCLARPAFSSEGSFTCHASVCFFFFIVFQKIQKFRSYGLDCLWQIY